MIMFLVFFVLFMGKAYASTYLTKLLIQGNYRFPINAVAYFKGGILYSDSNNLYFDNKLITNCHSRGSGNPWIPGQAWNDIELLKSTNGQLLINEIYVVDNDFYLATELGLFANDKRVFQVSPVQKVVIAKRKIYAASQLGLYTAEYSANNGKPLNDESSRRLEWQLMSNSPLGINFFTLNRTGSHVEFVSSENGSQSGFYYYDAKKDRWINRSYGLKRDSRDSFGFGRFLVLHEKKNNAAIFLPTSTGVYVSTDNGKQWDKYNDGLKANPDGFYTLREIKLFDGNLILTSSNGLYISQKDKIFWEKVNIENSKRGENFNEDYFSLAVSSDNNEILVGNSQGQIFTLKNFANTTTYLQTQISSEESENNERESLVQLEIKKILDSEPTIQEVQRIALQFAGIPTGDAFRSYKKQARLRNLIPDLEAFVDRGVQDTLTLETKGGDVFNSNTSSINTSFDKNNIDKSDYGLNAGIKFVWRLSNLIYDPEINDINTTARVTANIRENLLAELTQIYFSRKELLYKLLESGCVNGDPISSKELIGDQLRLEEYTAQLDARTGAWFSRQIDSRTIQQKNAAEQNSKPIHKQSRVSINNKTDK